MFKVEKIVDKDLKTSITLQIMNSLPKWFSPPEDILKKSVHHRDMPFLKLLMIQRSLDLLL